LSIAGVIQTLVEGTVLGESRLLRGDIAVHIAAGRILGIPDAFVALLGDRVERPQQLAVVRVEGLDEAADAVLAAVGTDDHLAVDIDWRHRLRIAEVGIGDLDFPQELARLGIERHELRVDGAHEELAFRHRDSAIVVAAANGDDRAQLVLVVPVLLAGRRVDRIDMIERGGQEHHAVDDDRRGFHRLEHRGLEDERRCKPAHVASVDLTAGVVAGIVVVAVGLDPVLRILGRAVEHRLGDRHEIRGHRHRGRGRTHADLLRCYRREKTEYERDRRGGKPQVSCHG
jgi:hypothetical protein